MKHRWDTDGTHALCHQTSSIYQATTTLPHQALLNQPIALSSVPAAQGLPWFYFCEGVQSCEGGMEYVGVQSTNQQN